MPPLELTPEECAELLEHGGVLGRVAMATPLGPRIVPVNYAVHDRAVVFRTAPYSELSTYGWNTELAFEVDHVDHEKRQGWSVVVLGRAHVVADPEELDAIRRSWEPRPWAGGTRNLHVRLPWRELSGRRVGADWSTASTAPHRRVV